MTQRFQSQQWRSTAQIDYIDSACAQEPGNIIRHTDRVERLDGENGHIDIAAAMSITVRRRAEKDDELNVRTAHQRTQGIRNLFGCRVGCLHMSSLAMGVS